MVIITKNKNKFVETRIDNEVVLMNVDNGNFYALKSTGLAIWDIIETKSNRASVINALTLKFLVANDLCETDVDAFLSEMVEAGFVTLG